MNWPRISMKKMRRGPLRGPNRMHLTYLRRIMAQNARGLLQSETDGESGEACVAGCTRGGVVASEEGPC